MCIHIARRIRVHSHTHTLSHTSMHLSTESYFSSVKKITTAPLFKCRPGTVKLKMVDCVCVCHMEMLLLIFEGYSDPSSHATSAFRVLSSLGDILVGG